MWRKLSPQQLFVGSFFGLILMGACGLRWLPGLYVGQGLSWTDCFYTATSAVCVTGLIVVDTATYFTFWGQAFILLLIQLGGLGIITFASLIIVALGRRMSLRGEALSGVDYDVAPQVSRQHLVRDVVRFTFAIEGAGAIALYLLWGGKLGWGEAAWPAVFHAVSAFCNAGFSTFSDNMMGYDDAPLTQVVIMALIVLGGLGFLTLEELKLLRKSRREKRRFRLSVHSRLVLFTTGLLIVGGAMLFIIFEWYGVLQTMPLADKISNALFMSVTSRTAGFNTIDYTQASPSSNFTTILLMSVGGSPGSTAGGIKTTTFALIGLLAWSRLRGRTIVTLASRSVPEETIQRAIGVLLISFSVVTAGILLLLATEHGKTTEPAFLRYMFEAASAFNTVGLSMNLSHELSDGSRWVCIVLMFVGRVGPMAFAAAIALSELRTSRFRYAYEDVVVG